ncbi:hypothetical protein OKB57_25095 (plasmid) [Serratia marcescens]|nr:hypothetical protein [Serratia marcescens]UYY70191.1 hypothetical protein OKB57_25095 [Serratia marcescens]
MLLVFGIIAALIVGVVYDLSKN